jgi:hypothetical protein
MRIYPGSITIFELSSEDIGIAACDERQLNVVTCSVAQAAGQTKYTKSFA